MTVNVSERRCSVQADAMAMTAAYGLEACKVAWRRASQEPEWSEGLRWWKVAEALAQKVDVSPA